MRRAILVLLLLTLVSTPSGAQQASPRLDLRDGDRVVFVGSTFIEREQQGGYIETMLISRSPGKHVIFRNVGYSGDTVSGEARGLCTGWSTFESPQQGLARLRKIIRELKPTVLIVNYGMNESFNGPTKLPDFISGLNMLLDMLSQDAKAEGAPGLREVLLLSPNFHEDLGRPLPDPAEHNQNLKLYCKAIEEVATKRRSVYVDLFSMTQKLAEKGHLTSNGIHLTPYGYWRVALAMEEVLGFPPRAGDVHEKAGAERLLPPPPPPAGSPPAENSALLAQWHEQSIEQAEKLRQFVVAKNFDFFNYFRPENDSYILSFRKNEQGKNAVELPQFKPLAQEKDEQIIKLSIPQPTIDRSKGEN